MDRGDERPWSSAWQLESRHAVKHVDGPAAEVARRVPEGPEEALRPGETPDLHPREIRAGRTIDVEDPLLLRGQVVQVLRQRAGVPTDPAAGLHPEARVDRDAHLAVNTIRFAGWWPGNSATAQPCTGVSAKHPPGPDRNMW